MEYRNEENPRVIKTRKSIRKAFRELILADKPEDINVKHLTDMAGIHRKTFYLHYTCIEALYEDMIQEVVKDYANEVKKLSVPYDYYDLTKVMFEFYSGDLFIEKLICDSQYQEFCNKIMLRQLEHNRARFNPFRQYSEEEQKLINTFLACSSLDVFRSWIKSGKKIPMKTAIKITGDLLENGVRGIMTT